MNLLRHREPGRHRADSLTPPRPRGLAALPARHARRPRPQIVKAFTGWASLARVCDDAVKHPVIDPRIACPAQASFDPDLTQPFFLEIPPMTRPRNTRDDIIPIPALHGVHIPGAIEAQEAEGAAAMQRDDCDVIPVEIKGGTEADLTALGFVLGPTDPEDPLFRKAALPDGWTRAGTGHSMATDILDELGRKRVKVFYKAAYYDRRADLTVTTLNNYVGTCLYQGTAPVLDEKWATRDAVVAELDRIAEREREEADEWAQRVADYAREYEAEARERLAKAEALRATLTGGAE